MLVLKHSHIVRMVSSLMAICLFGLPAYARYSGGSGTAEDPYRIATAADLITLGETPADYDKHFLLTADIDLDPNLPGGKVFDKAIIAPGSPINDYPYVEGTAFTGVFDGHGHIISHLTIIGKDYVGLFGYIVSPAEVRDLGVVCAIITAMGSCAGGLVGSNGDPYSGRRGGGTPGGIVTQCYSTGMVDGNDLVGGLVGDNYGSVVMSYSTSAVSGRYCVGGLVLQRYRNVQ